ncbi:hypothetical protein VTO73DRAFT_1272 [Trametes versicolor]
MRKARRPRARRYWHDWATLTRTHSPLTAAPSYAQCIGAHTADRAPASISPQYATVAWELPPLRRVQHRVTAPRDEEPRRHGVATRLAGGGRSRAAASAASPSSACNPRYARAIYVSYRRPLLLRLRRTAGTAASSASDARSVVRRRTVPVRDGELLDAPLTLQPAQRFEAAGPDVGELWRCGTNRLSTQGPRKRDYENGTAAPSPSRYPRPRSRRLGRPAASFPEPTCASRVRGSPAFPRCLAPGRKSGGPLAVSQYIQRTYARRPTCTPSFQADSRSYAFPVVRMTSAKVLNGDACARHSARGSIERRGRGAPGARTVETAVKTDSPKIRERNHLRSRHHAASHALEERTIAADTQRLTRACARPGNPPEKRRTRSLAEHSVRRRVHDAHSTRTDAYQAPVVLHYQGRVSRTHGYEHNKVKTGRILSLHGTRG